MSRTFADYLAFQIYLGNLEKDQIYATYPSEKDAIEKKLEELSLIPVEKE